MLVQVRLEIWQPVRDESFNARLSKIKSRIFVTSIYSLPIIYILAIPVCILRTQFTRVLFEISFNEKFIVRSQVFIKQIRTNVKIFFEMFDNTIAQC